MIDHAADNHRLTLGEAVLEGTGGEMSLNGYGEVHLRKAGQTQTKCILSQKEWPGFAGDCVMRLNQHVVSHILDGSALENEANDYAIVTRVEEAAYQSQETGQRIDI